MFALFPTLVCAVWHASPTSATSCEQEEYGALSLVSTGPNVAHVLDVAAQKAKMDVMPPRAPGPIKLDRYQSDSLKLSMKSIEELEVLLAKKTNENKSTDGQHCVAYICAFNTLVHNPEGIKQFVDTVDRIATSGVVDKQIIPGMALDEAGNEVGLFLHIDINAYV